MGEVNRDDARSVIFPLPLYRRVFHPTSGMMGGLAMEPDFIGGVHDGPVGVSRWMGQLIAWMSLGSVEDGAGSLL